MASGALVGSRLPRGPRLHSADTARTDAASRVPGHNRGSFYHLFMESKDPAEGRSHLSGGCRTLQLLPVPVSFPRVARRKALLSILSIFTFPSPKQCSVLAYTPKVSVERKCTCSIQDWKPLLLLNQAATRSIFPSAVFLVLNS